MAYSDPYNPGVTRHAAQAQISRPELDQPKPNYSISQPAGPSQGWSSTGSITNSAGARNRKSPRGPKGSSPLSGLDSMLNLDNAQDIISASGLGRPSDGRSIGERLSDADQPTQAIETQSDGSMVHRRANPSGNVTATPLGSYGTGSYGTELDYLSELN